MRDTRSEEPLKNILDENSPELQERKLFLNSYLKKICSDQSQMAFWEYLDKVGCVFHHSFSLLCSGHLTPNSAMHVGLHREKPLRVEYIHISATLCLIQHVFTEAILSHNALPMSKRTAMVKALSKVIWIQNDLFAKWYVRDGDEFNNGHSTFASLTAEEGSAKSKVAMGEADKLVCPFSGMKVSA